VIAALFVGWTLGDWLTLAAAVPAGIGGVLLGDRITGAWLARRGPQR
jgi:hypothetical protein